jgi:Domain of unknown function (DUF4328)
MAAAGLLVTVILSGKDIFNNLRHDWPGSLSEVWLIATLATGAPFLIWFARARANTASYGPGRIRRCPDWTLAGWFCPVTWFWVPYLITAEILRASARPTAGTEGGRNRARAMVTMLTAWWALWLGTWLVWWFFALDYLADSDSGVGVTRPQQLLDLAFNLLSISAAGCAIAVIAIITRLQARRATEPAFASDTGPRKRRTWPLLVTGIPLVPAVLVIFFAIARTGWLLSPADLIPTRSEVVGTWRAGDGGTLLFYQDNRFSGRGLSVNPLTGIPVSNPWAGAGQWTISSGACDGSAPGVCLRSNPPISSEDGWTAGSPRSLTMILPTVPAGEDYDSAGYEYTFRKQR